MTSYGIICDGERNPCKTNQRCKKIKTDSEDATDLSCPKDFLELNHQFSGETDARLTAWEVSFSKTFNATLLATSLNPVDGNDLHGCLLHGVPAALPSGPDYAIVVTVLTSVLCGVLTTCGVSKTQGHLLLASFYSF